MKFAIFGLGFIGQALATRATDLGHDVQGFSRRAGHGSGRSFDAGNPEDCDALFTQHPARALDGLVVTFPPQHAAPSFWRRLITLAPRRVLLGSTGVYQRAVDCTQPLITEETPLLDLHPRLPAEQAFLATHDENSAGASLVLRLAGLYGGARNPVRWIRDGRVGYEKRQANLVHRDDVIEIILRLLAHPTPRTVYNLSDGQRHTWREIIDALVTAGHLQPLPPAAARRNDAFVPPSRVLQDFPDVQLRDLWAELDVLAKQASPG